MNEITLKSGQLPELHLALTALLSLKLTIKVSYRAGKLLRKVAQELADFHKTKNELLVKLGDLTDPETQNYTIRPENMEEWSREIATLIDEPVTLVGVAKIMLSDIDNLVIDADIGTHLQALEPILEESE